MADPTPPVPPPPGDASARADQAGERFLFERSPLPMWIYDLETLRFLDVNEVACSHYGWSREEFLAMTIRDIRPPQDRAALEATIAELGGRSFSASLWRHRRKDGSSIDVEVRSHELLFEGRRTRVVCPIDVTLRVRAEAALHEREAALRRAQDLARLGHAVTRPDGSFESWSESLPSLVGLPAARMPASTREWIGLLHPGDRAMFRGRSIEAAVAGRGVDVEYRLLRGDGATIHVRQVIEPIRDADGAFGGRWFSTLQDVTGQKAAEIAVRRVNEALEERVRERTAQLERSNDELALAKADAERANGAKSEFLSSMSHELRTPLNAIIGFGQLLASAGTDEGGGDPQRAVFVDHIVDAGHHLLALINEILDLAQVESGRIEVRAERVELGALFAECEAMLAPSAAAAGVATAFSARPGLAAHADRTRLKQVLLNLASNAIKYNRPQGRVAVVAERLGDRVRIAVRDTGFGLTAAQLGALFQPFNRLGQEGGTTPGSGIGLVLTRRLAELMGGAVSVSSAPGEGSAFFVELPLSDAAADAPGESADARAAAAPAPDATAAPAAAARHATLLCVDDDPASLHLVQQVLTALPALRVITASDGESAVEIAQALVPDAILMDGSLPGLGGGEALARLRADPRTARIPVIALTAHAMAGAAEAGIAAGYFRYLTKPFERTDLLRAVREAVAAGRAPA
jgi:PAS domain S-box-containing protein